MTSPEIRQIVQDVYSHHLALPQEWTPDQRREFIETEAARISRQIADLADQMGAQSVTEWTARTGAHPDYLTTVGLLNTAMSAAKEIVLNKELYELIPQPADPPSELDASPRHWITVRCHGISGGRARSTAATPASRSRTWSRRYGRTRTSRRCSGSRPDSSWRPAPRTSCPCRAIGGTR